MDPRLQHEEEALQQALQRARERARDLNVYERWLDGLAGAEPPFAI
ncbi:MAG: hypothetical protein HY319_10880 [Armatimonadetes bacterium]|nr:hypothetical protein [Armatimonadota bacterium]